MNRSIPVASLLFVVLSVAAGCGGGAVPAKTETPAASVHAAHAPNRGPVSLEIDPRGDADPASLTWDEATHALYIADNRHDQLWRWDDELGFQRLATLPDDPVATAAERANVGQIVRLDDGTFVVPRFGFGEHGGILFTNPKTGRSGAIPGASPDRRRVALARGDGGSLWGAYFLHPKGADPQGVVTKVTLESERDYATGFKKVVGVIVHGDKLLVSDQTQGTIFALPLVDPPAAPPYAEYAKVPSCDSLAEGPDGTVVTGQFRAAAEGAPLQVRQVFPDGRVQPVETGSLVLSRPQGLAYDKTNRRLFIADSDGRRVRTVKIVPL